MPIPETHCCRGCGGQTQGRIVFLEAAGGNLSGAARLPKCGNTRTPPATPGRASIHFQNPFCRIAAEFLNGQIHYMGGNRGQDLRQLRHSLCSGSGADSVAQGRTASISPRSLFDGRIGGKILLSGARSVTKPTTASKRMHRSTIPPRIRGPRWLPCRSASLTRNPARSF